MKGDLLIYYALSNVYFCDHLCFMLFGSLSENNGGSSVDNFTASNSEIIIHRASRLLSVISRKFRKPNIPVSVDLIGQLFNGKRRVMGSEATTYYL